MSNKPGPQDHREAMALFRASIVGGLVHRLLAHGDLAAELRALADEPLLPPGRQGPRKYGFSTLERWYYAYKDGHLSALRSKPRSDTGYVRCLTDAQRHLLLEIREESPSASSRLILRTLVSLGRLTAGAVTPSSLNRFYAAHGLRRTRRDGSPTHQRLRWLAEAPHALWHADVCHGADLKVGRRKQPVRIHGILDDNSRDIIALEALPTEREVDMLDLLMKALLRVGRPKALFLDNGATYRGHALRTVCERLDTTLIHARPRQPEGRGKMERFWRTLREQCLDFIPETATLQDVNRHLAMFRMQYRDTPHAGLMGDTPKRVVLRGEAQPVSEDALRAAFTVELKRRVKRDSTVSIRGRLYQVAEYMLAGKTVRVSVNLLDGKPAAHVAFGGREYALEPVNPLHNGKVRRSPVASPKKPKTGFDPNDARRRDIVAAIRRAQKEGSGS